MRNLQVGHRVAKRLANVLQAFHVQIVQHEAEFLSAEARAGVKGPAGKLLHNLGDGHQCVIACFVPVVIVERLEVIHVHKDQAKHLVIALRTAVGQAKARLETPAVEQLGERIGFRELLERRLSAVLGTKELLHQVGDQAADGREKQYEEYLHQDDQRGIHGIEDLYADKHQ